MESEYVWGRVEENIISVMARNFDRVDESVYARSKGRIIG